MARDAEFGIVRIVMPIDPDLLVALDAVDTNALLEPFRWLLPQRANVLLVSAIGDLFLTDERGAVWRLDVGCGSYASVADSESEFWQRVEVPAVVDEWFAPGLVDALGKSGRVRGRGDCYCYVRLPMLGGNYEPSNFVVRDVVTHFRIWGPLLKEVWDLPDGSQVAFKTEP